MTMRPIVLLMLSGPILPAQQILQSFSPFDFEERFTPMGDRNGDGYEDVMVTSVIAHSFSIVDYELRLYSGRDGALLRRGPYWPYPDGGVAFPTGDHDGDGIRDYICRDTDMANAMLRISVRSGLDDHVFWMVQNPIVNNWAYDVIGNVDVDGDGQLDVVVSDPGGGGSQGDIWAYDHWGNLLYHRTGAGPSYTLAQSLAKLGDIDGDGCDDYICGLGDPTYYGAVAIITGRTGQIIRVVTGQNFGDYIGSGCIGCGDLDGDGLPDFAAGGGLSGTNGSVQAFSSRTGARLWTCYSGYRNDRFGKVLRAADYDHDGVDDIIAAGWGGMRVVSGRDGSIIALYIPNSTASWATFEAEPLRTPTLFPHILVRTQVLGTFLMSAAPHASALLGTGCLIGTTTNSPQIGLRELAGFDRRLTLSNAAPGTVAFLLLGLADLSTGPINLAPMGLPNCSVHPNLLSIACFLTGSSGIDGGFARHDFAIATATAFGLGIDAQWVTLDQNGSPAGLSQAIRFAIRP